MAQAAVTMGEQAVPCCAVPEGMDTSAMLKYSQRWIFLLPSVTSLARALTQTPGSLPGSLLCSVS